jgi:hypothetical protein
MSSNIASPESTSKDGVITFFYIAGSGDQRESILDDLAVAMAEATDAQQPARVRRASDLLFVYFGDQLPSLGVQRLVELLEGRRVWRRYNEWPVYKTAGTPCLAFTATVDDAVTKVNLVAIGLCNRYPSDDEEAWWQATIRPRVESMSS